MSPSLFFRRRFIQRKFRLAQEPGDDGVLEGDALDWGANRKVAKFQKPFYIYVTELYNCFDMMRNNVKWSRKQSYVAWRKFDIMHAD